MICKLDTTSAHECFSLSVSPFLNLWAFVFFFYVSLGNVSHFLVVENRIAPEGVQYNLQVVSDGCAAVIAANTKLRLDLKTSCTFIPDIS